MNSICSVEHDQLILLEVFETSVEAIVHVLRMIEDDEQYVVIDNDNDTIVLLSCQKNIVLVCEKSEITVYRISRSHIKCLNCNASKVREDGTPCITCDDKGLVQITQVESTKQTLTYPVATRPESRII